MRSQIALQLNVVVDKGNAILACIWAAWEQTPRSDRGWQGREMNWRRVKGTIKISTPLYDIGETQSHPKHITGQSLKCGRYDAVNNK